MNLLPAYTREVVQKLIQAVTSLEILNECLHGYARTHENRGTRNDLGVTVDDTAVGQRGWSNVSHAAPLV
jgi:hypothetical protein